MTGMTRFSPARSRRPWWVAAVTGLVVLVTGWSTGVPDVLTEPLRAEFGWSRGTIAFAFAVNMALYGLTAPFAAALMDRIGIRRVVGGALAIVAAGSALTAAMAESWQLLLGWGLLVGLGTGSMALTFAATVANRWFVARRGLVSGVLTSSSMFGGMVLMPLLAWIVHHEGWRIGAVVVGAASLALVPLVFLVLRDHPGEVGARAHGAAEFTAPPARSEGAARRALVLLGNAAKTKGFWLLAVTFGICGASTNGIMMTHFVPAATGHGMHMVVAASLLAVMGVFNVVGAAGSGWLTDRFSARWLLVGHYGARAVSLLVLPLFMGSGVGAGMIVFTVVYGLLDLATVPPTIALCREFFGADNGPIVFGWLSAVHALGAGAAALSGGVLRGLAGSYTAVWLGSGVLCLAAAALSVRLGTGVRSRAAGGAFPAAVRV